MGKAMAWCHTALPFSCHGSSVSFLDAFQRGKIGISFPKRKIGVSPSGIVLAADVTEKDSPQLCLKENR